MRQPRQDPTMPIIPAAAAGHVEVDWNEQVSKAARNCLKISPFSRSSLIQQLESSADDKYTHKQAVYGVKKAGL